MQVLFSMYLRQRTVLNIDTTRISHVLPRLQPECPGPEHKEREYVDLTTTDEEVDARATTFGTY